MSLARRMEGRFEAWSRLVIRFRWASIALTLLLAVGLATQLLRLRTDNDPLGFLDHDDPALVIFDAFREQFGRDDLILLAIRPARLFDLESLAKLRALHADLESQVPELEEVTSLVNARTLRGSEEALEVGELLEEWPLEPAGLAELERRVLANPLYRDTLISDDARWTVVSLKSELLDSDAAEGEAGTEERSSAQVRAVRAVVERYDSTDFRILTTGPPVIRERLNQAVEQDIERFVALAALTIAAFLLLLFRRLSAVLLSLAVVVCSVSSTLGVMAISDTPLSVVTAFLPSFLMVVGVCDSIHVLTLVYQRLERGDAKFAAISRALGHCGPAMLFTGVTTAGGLVAFLGADLVPVSHLGVFGPLGVMLALFYTLTLLPALLAVAPLRQRARAEGGETGAGRRRALVAIGEFSVRHPWKIVAGMGALVLAAFLSALQLRFSFHLLEWFPPGDPLRVATETIDRELNGTMVLEVLVDAREENALFEPALLDRIDALARHARSLERGAFFVGKATSIVDLVKEIHQALNEDRAEFYAIPRERALVAQELLVFESAGSEDLHSVSDSRFRLARVTLRVPRVDATLYGDLLDEFRDSFAAIIGDQGRVSITGGMAVLGQIANAVTTSMASSYVYGLLAITPIMILALGSLRLGLLSMIPNLTPIVLTLGLMPWLDIPLDSATLCVGSIVLGVAVDDTVHFMLRFKSYLEELGDTRAAIRLTLETTGAAMLVTSLVIAAGFFALMLGYLKSIAAFGFLAGFAMLTALAAEVLLGPALVTLALGGTRTRAAHARTEPGASEVRR